MDNLTEHVKSLQQEVRRKVRNKERVRKDPYSSSDEDNHCIMRTENQHIRRYRQILNARLKLFV